jgi:hypothetical protein
VRHRSAEDVTAEIAVEKQRAKANNDDYGDAPVPSFSTHSSISVMMLAPCGGRLGAAKKWPRALWGAARNVV